MKASEKVVVEVLKSLNKANEMICERYMRNEPIDLYSPPLKEPFIEMTLGEVLSKVITKVAGLLGTEIETIKDAD